MARPVLKSLEGKAAITWTGGAYEAVREQGRGARTPQATFSTPPTRENNP
jgi:hypothetical protein